MNNNEELKAQVAKWPRQKLNTEVVCLMVEQEGFRRDARIRNQRITRLQTLAEQKNKQLESLRTALLESQAEVERLRCELWQISNVEAYPTAKDGMDRAVKYASEALSQTPPPTFASKVMELARSGWQVSEGTTGNPDIHQYEGIEACLEAAAAFTPEELTWLGGK